MKPDSSIVGAGCAIVVIWGLGVAVAVTFWGFVIYYGVRIAKLAWGG